MRRKDVALAAVMWLRSDEKLFHASGSEFRVRLPVSFNANSRIGS